MSVQRGEIYFVFLDPVFGREIGGYKTRPVAVLSINDINEKPLVLTVIPGTSAEKKPIHHRNRVLVRPSLTNGLANDTIFECHQIRAIDKGRLISRPVGRLSADDLQKIEEATKYCLGLFS
jgi:mRNA interferase MazF